MSYSQIPYQATKEDLCCQWDCTHFPEIRKQKEEKCSWRSLVVPLWEAGCSLWMSYWWLLVCSSFSRNFQLPTGCLFFSSSASSSPPGSPARLPSYVTAFSGSPPSTADLLLMGDQFWLFSVTAKFQSPAHRSVGTSEGARCSWALLRWLYPAGSLTQGQSKSIGW